ncbi:hypothetical protein QJ48_32110 [Paenibacillus sp. A3]|uniref:hypothetical protein n=1 Tax=Paenibacillus sp. A3 TaxID=1337054 RepID=UPI0006D5486E|nr:hypothetical protein [Paenibacillus sp. A3]KPV55617.1 hypothetical protein QJ48_32110 [Paenibacillus sp. A3]
MTFMLLEHSPRPLKLRGNKITAATVIPLSKERLSAGDCVGTKSGLIIKLISSSGHLTPGPEARDAFYLSDVTPATLDEAAASAQDGEVFVPIHGTWRIHQLQADGIKPLHWPDSLDGYWITVSFVQNHLVRGCGWLRKTATTGEMILVNGELNYGRPLTITAMKTLRKATVECECRDFAFVEVNSISTSNEVL